MIKVKDEKGLLRDPSSKAILVVDASALSEHRRKKEIMKKMHTEASKISMLEEKIEQQANDISAIKDMLVMLINKEKNNQG